MLKLAGVLGLALLAAAPQAEASCIETNKVKAHIQADVVFEGVALDGPTVPHGDTEILTSPMSFRVTRYVKGDGPPVVKVHGGTPPPLGPGDPVGPFSTNLLPVEAGQTWRIYGDGSPDGIVRASSCTSYRVGAPEPFDRLGPTGRQIAVLALGISGALWAIFLARALARRLGRRG